MWLLVNCKLELKCATNCCIVNRFSYLSFGSLLLLQRYCEPLDCVSD